MTPHTPYAAPKAVVTDLPEPVRIGRYAAIYAAALVVAIAVVLLIVFLTDYEPGGVIGLVEMLAAASFTGALFVWNNGRVPTADERRKLVWLSFGTSVLIPLAAIAAFLGYFALQFGVDDLMQGLAESIPKLPLFVWAIITVVTLGLTYATLRLGYGLATNSLAKQIQRKSGP